MTVWEAARQYRYWHHLASERSPYCAGPTCAVCDRRWLLVEAASVAYDLAVAEDVARKMVAW